MEPDKILKIIGMDEKRPARISTSPYIELFFKLSYQASLTWCQDFNLIFDKYKYSVRIDINKGVFIETWVRNMEEISGHFELLKAKIVECNEAYAKKQAALELALLGKNDDVSKAQGEQARLNAVLAGLNYDV